MNRIGSIGDLHILTVHTPPRTFVSVSGPLDIATRDHLGESLLTALSQTAPDGAFEVDVTDVDFADSSGVLALLAVRRSASERGIDMALTNPSRQIRFLIEVLERLPATPEPADGRTAGPETEVRLAP